MPNHLELVEQAGVVLVAGDLLRREVVPALDLDAGDEVELEVPLARGRVGLGGTAMAMQAVCNPEIEFDAASA